MMANMFDRGALPVLERLVQFTDARHQVLANDIANLDTPYFLPQDLSADQFEATLRDAIEKRRGSVAGDRGPLDLDDTDELHFTPHGIKTQPMAANNNILFHDRNNRNVERIMEHLAQNTLQHNAAVQLLKNQFDMLRTAIRGTVQ